MAKTIAIVNQKGGVGKTTTCVNLAAALKLLGIRVLVCDFDPQANTTSGLGVDKTAASPSIYDVLIDGADCRKAVVPTPWADVIPSNKALAGATVEMIGMDRREYLLKRALSSFQEDYDYIFVDCPPSLELLTLNALCAADTILVPVQCEYYALEGHPDRQTVPEPLHRPGGRGPHHVRRPDQSIHAGGGGGQAPLPRQGLRLGHPPERPAVRGPQPRQAGNGLRQPLPGRRGLSVPGGGAAGEKPLPCRPAMTPHPFSPERTDHMASERGLSKGLGKGLGALLGDAALQSQEGGSVSLPIAQVEPGLKQPRKRFDEESLADLADSIRLHGIIQPLTVRRLASGYYQIIAGERRWRAAKLAGLAEVPAVIIEADDRKVMELGLIENLQREDLNPMEEAQGYKSLMEDYGLTQEETAQRVGKSRPAVANALRLLALPDAVCQLLEEGRLSAGHARAILAAPAGELQKRLARKVVEEGLSVRQTEALAKRLSREQQELDECGGEKPVDPMKLYRDAAAKELSTHWGRKVSITMGPKKGRLEFEFYNDEDLTLLLDQLETRLASGKGGGAR